MQQIIPDAAEDVSGTGTETLLWSFTRKPHRMKKRWLKNKNVRNATNRVKISRKEKQTTWMSIWSNSDNKNWAWTENADNRVPFHAKHSSFKNFWSARQLQIAILSDNWDRVLLRRVDISNCFSTNLETKCYFFSNYLSFCKIGRNCAWREYY